VLATIVTPTDYVGACMELCTERRCVFRSMEGVGTVMGCTM